MTVLVTGGAGYIGAHVVRLLQQRKEPVVVVDDLSSGDASRIGDAELIELDISTDEAPEKIAKALAEHSVRAVIHFAARKQVGESVEKPAWYFQQNIGGMANILAAAEHTNVDRLVFSSSAATYGIPNVDLVTEDLTAQPINPYGQTKLVGEWMAKDASTAWGLRSVNLRYFNVAGAGWDDLGDPAVMNLVPIVLNRLDAGKNPIIFGDDYDTPDGTCIRDYVHVLDLADAHIAAIDYLDKAVRPHSTFNVGTGTGASVKEIIHHIAETAKITITPEIGDRRAGDPPRLVADVSRIQGALGWKAKHDIPEIIASAISAHNYRKNLASVGS